MAFLLLLSHDPAKLFQKNGVYTLCTDPGSSVNEFVKCVNFSADPTTMILSSLLSSPGPPLLPKFLFPFPYRDADRSLGPQRLASLVAWTKADNVCNTD